MSLQFFAHEADFMSPIKKIIILKLLNYFSLQTNAQLQKEIDALNLEKQNLEKKSEASTKEAKGNRTKNSYAALI